jgi:hypothetical protein
MADHSGTFQELVDCLSGKIGRPKDWRALIALAGTTLTIGTLADAFLSTESVAVPADVRALLTDVRDRARKRNALLVGQFEELLPALHAIGVEPIPMKGLARLLGSADEQSRLLSDIDLLVPAERLHDCVSVLKRLGYDVIVGPEHDSRAFVLGRPQDVGTLDLHTALKPYYLDFGYADIAPHCRAIAVAEGNALVPDPTCQLLLEVLHDQLNDRDYWRGLIDVRHLLDVRSLVQEGIDWPRLASAFAPGTATRAFKLQMLTASTLMTVDIPQAYRDGAWTRLQMLRRRAQMRFPISRWFFTLLTMALDPPRESGRSADAEAIGGRGRGIRHRIGGRLERYLWLSYPGKL